jgi:hypothetical protein
MRPSRPGGTVSTSSARAEDGSGVISLTSGPGSSGTLAARTSSAYDGFQTHEYVKALVDLGYWKLLSRPERDLVIVAIRHANKWGQAWPGRAVMRTKSGLHDRVQRRAIERLISCGVMKRRLVGKGRIKGLRVSHSSRSRTMEDSRGPPEGFMKMKKLKKNGERKLNSMKDEEKKQTEAPRLQQCISELVSNLFRSEGVKYASPEAREAVFKALAKEAKKHKGGET